MATHDYVIDNSTGANVRADLNLVLQAILSNNSSSSAPSTTAAYMWWADTTNGVLKIRNSANNAWVELLQLDGTLTLEDGSASTPALAFRDDLNTGIFSSAADHIEIATGGTERVSFGTSGVAFNDDGNDYDFRIEGDTNQDLFFVDASTDKVGIGTGAPADLFHCNLAAENGSIARFGLSGQTNNQMFIIKADDSDSLFTFRFGSTNSTYPAVRFNMGADEEAMRLDNAGRLLLGTTTEGNSSADDLTIANSGNVGITLRSGTSSQGAIYFSDATSGDAEFDGFLGYSHNNQILFFGSAQSTRLRIDSSGHMGLGVTPDDGWPSNGDYRAFQLGTGACIFGRGSGDEDRGGLAVNYYATGSGNKFLANGHANLVYLNDGNIDFYTSAQNTSGADADLSLIHVMAIKPDKDVEIKDGNLVIGTSGHGIDFASNTENESGAGSSYGTVLDDYEEGSWTPTFDAPNQSSTTFGINHQYGYYTKIGNLVHVTCYLQGFADQNTSGGSNDGIVITGLPFTVAALPSTSNVRHAASLAVGSRYRLEVDDLIIHAFGNQNVAKLLVPSNGNVMEELKSNQMRARSGTNEVYFAGSYRVHA